jgi:hypothetical protein
MTLLVINNVIFHISRKHNKSKDDRENANGSKKKESKVCWVSPLCYAAIPRAIENKIKKGAGPRSASYRGRV